MPDHYLSDNFGDKGMQPFATEAVILHLTTLPSTYETRRRTITAQRLQVSLFRLILFLLLLPLVLSSAAAADLNGDLLKAAGKFEDQSDTVLFLLKRGANVNAQDKDGRTALHLSVLRDHHQTVAVLLSHGADVNARDKEGNTALQLATKLNRRRIASMLLEAGARIVIPDSPNPQNPSELILAELPQRLHEAVAKGDLVLLQRLLRNGVPVDATMPGKPDTPLLEACANGHLEAAKVLLAAGADARKQGKDGRTALHLAALAGSLPLVELLAQTPIDLNAQDSSKKTAVDAAVAARSLPVLSFLLDRKVSPSEHDKALELALNTKNQTLAERLLTIAPTISTNGFLIAIRFGLSDFVSRYLEAGNKVPPLALILAARNGDVSLCEILMNKGVNPSGPPGDDSVATPLVVALRERHPEVARLLLSRGADPGIPVSGPSAPLSLARSAGYDDLVKTIEDALRSRAALVKQRMESVHRLRLSVSVPRMAKVTRQGNTRTIHVDLAQLAKENYTDEHWTPLVRRAVEDAVSSFGVVLVETGQDADLNVIFQGYSAYSPDFFQNTSEVLFNAFVVLNVPDLGPFHKYAWTVPFISRQDEDNYSKYFGSSGEVNETKVLTDFKDAVKSDLTGVFSSPAPKTSPVPKVGTPSPAKKTAPVKKQSPVPDGRKGRRPTTPRDMEQKQ